MPVLVALIEITFSGPKCAELGGVRDRALIRNSVFWHSATHARNWAIYVWDFHHILI